MAHGPHVVVLGDWDSYLIILSVFASVESYTVYYLQVIQPRSSKLGSLKAKQTGSDRLGLGTSPYQI